MPDDPKKVPTMERKNSGASVGRRASVTETPEGKVVTWENGDTLCGIARAAGHPNCDPIRKSPLNKTLSEKNWQLAVGDHVFVPNGPKSWQDKVHTTVRFIRGSDGLDPNLTELFVSNYPPDKCGIGVDVDFPVDPVYGFDANIFADPDTFKVEVVDPLMPHSATPTVTVEALMPVVGAAGITGHTPFGISRANPRQLSATLGPDVVGARRSGYLRLVTTNEDRRARDQLSILVGVVEKQSIGKKFLNDPQIEILDQDVRATYTLPCCNGSPPVTKCSVSTTIPLSRGKRMGVGVRVLRAVPTGVVVDRLSKTYKAAQGQESDIVTLDWVLNHFNGTIREVFAQAHLSFPLKRLERVDPPSDMLAIGDWDGKVFSVGRLHAAENGKPSSKPKKVQFNIIWSIPDADTKTINIGPVDIPQGKTPKDTALLIQAAIAKKSTDANPAVSENPKQTNAAGASCDIIFAPPRGRMTIDKLQGVDDPDQPIHVIRIDLSQDIVLSNFPESYHIGSPQMRLLIKSFTWTPEEEIKVIFAAPGAFKLASGGEPVAMGLGALRDFSASTPLASMRNSIFASHDVMNNRLFMAHEIGHVLIDTGAHSLSDHQVMRAMPIDKQSRRFLEHLPPAANWEYFPLSSDTKTPDFITGVTRYATVAVNPVARMHKLDNAMGKPVVPPDPKPFTPLQDVTLTALKNKMQELLTKLFAAQAPQVAAIVRGSNYVCARDVKLYAWDKYRAAFELNNPDWLQPIKSSLLEAAQVGSAKIKQILSGVSKENENVRFARILLDTTDKEFWDGFVTQCPSAPSLVTASTPLAGFRGLMLGNQAIFIAIEDFMQEGKVEPTGQKTQPGPTIQRHCYTVMHETLHFYSYQGKGFQHNTVATPAGASGAWQTVLDEGATEFFTRLLLYRSDKDDTFKNLAEHPEIPFFGLDSNYLPVYEVPKNIVAQMVKDVGLPVLAKAYFLGQFQAFFSALDGVVVSDAQRYGQDFWRALGNLAYTARPYLNSASPENQALETIRGIRMTGVDQTASPTLILRPADVITSWSTKTYDDPVKQFVASVYP